MLRFLTLLSFLIAFAWAVKPMESVKNYNVILVHGAADMRSGLDCKNDNRITEVFKADTTPDYLTRVGGYGSVYFWDGDFHGGFLYQKKSSDATGMVTGLRDWLTDNIFENDKRAVYLQRPFVNPAGSPFENGKEIGWSGWKGEDKCIERRSLIEEAQEVKAKGRGKLKDYRANSEYYYKDSILPPSRNIIIAHSMGGVASREYVQTESLYKNDVDKVITLDSPHEGTEHLC